MVRLLATCLALPLAAGAEANLSWDVLMEKLKPNEKVVVTRMNSGNVEGKLLGITGDSITVRWNGRPQEIRRDDVFRVRVADIRKHHTLIGMAAGFGGGAIIGARSVTCCRGATALGVGLFGMGIGAAVGGALPIGKPLYELDKPRRRSP